MTDHLIFQKPQAMVEIARKILAIHVDPSDLLIIMKCLQNDHIELETVDCGQSSFSQGLEILLTKYMNIDCLIINYDMPKGISFLQELKSHQETKSIPVIILTELDIELEGEKILMEYLKAGAEFFINKYSAPSSICAKLRSALKIRAIQRDLDYYYQFVEKKRILNGLDGVGESSVQIPPKNLSCNDQAKEKRGQGDFDLDVDLEPTIISQCIQGGANESQPLTVLLIEDDPGHARLIEKNLRRTAIINTIIKLDDGQQAADFLFNHRNHLDHHSQICPAPKDEKGLSMVSMVSIDQKEYPRHFLILLDLNLPLLSGYEILKLLKKHENTRHIPVIVLTTIDNPSDISKCYELGCNVFITKPVKAEDFSEAVRKLGLFISTLKIPMNRLEI